MSFADEIVNELDNTIMYVLIEGIKKDVIELAKLRVPIDTELFRDTGFTITSTKSGDNYEILLFVNDNTLAYDKSSVRASMLGMILNIGVRGGKVLARTRSQPQNSAGSPTQGWFTKDLLNDITLYFDSGKYKKWIN